MIKKEYFKKWRKQNKKHIKQYHKEWRSNNKNYYRKYYSVNFKGRGLPQKPNYILQESDLINKKFGEWTVLAEYIEKTNKRRYLLVECSCKKKRYVQKYSITCGESTSCGHWRKEKKVVE